MLPSSAPHATAVVGTRYGRSATSFGLVGRLAWTALVIAPPVPFLLISLGFVGWSFAGIWWGVVTPWAMRDLWRSGHRRIQVTTLR